MLYPSAEFRVTTVVLMARRYWIAFLATVFLSSLAGAAQNIDKGGGKAWWPQFRGANSSGIGTGKPPVQFGPGQNVLWKVAVGPGLSSPIVWNGRIFLTEFDSANKQLATLCIDQRTGKILWRRTVAARDDRKGPRNQQSGRFHAGHRWRAPLCLLRVIWADRLRSRRQPAVGEAVS